MNTCDNYCNAFYFMDTFYGFSSVCLSKHLCGRMELALPALDHEVLGSNPAGGGIYL